MITPFVFAISNAANSFACFSVLFIVVLLFGPLIVEVAANGIRDQLVGLLRRGILQLCTGRRMVAAAAESFHQQLHIDVACRTSGNRHIIAAAERNNACMCADDGQQLVCCLCGRNTVYLLTGDSEDNALTAVARGRDRMGE